MKYVNEVLFAWLRLRLHLRYINDTDVSHCFDPTNAYQSRNKLTLSIRSQ